MAYLPLNNFKYDSGPHRIQSGPDHQGYTVLNSGVQSFGADNGIVVDGTPLSGALNVVQRWGYDANWRYVPYFSQSSVYTTDSTNPGILIPSGNLKPYTGVRVYSRVTFAGSQAATSITSQYGQVASRQAALQSDGDIVVPEKYMYFGGAAPDNQNYSPYNTPETNSASEGTTGGGVTHRTYESSILINILGSQGTANRAEWSYNQPVYCRTYTESIRPTTPGIMSSVVRSIYRDHSTSYNFNYGYPFGGGGFGRGGGGGAAGGGFGQGGGGGGGGNFDAGGENPGEGGREPFELSFEDSYPTEGTDITVPDQGDCIIEWYVDGIFTGVTGTTYTVQDSDIGLPITAVNTCTGEETDEIIPDIPQLWWDGAPLALKIGYSWSEKLVVTPCPPATTGGYSSNSGLSGEVTIFNAKYIRVATYNYYNYAGYGQYFSPWVKYSTTCTQFEMNRSGVLLYTQTIDQPLTASNIYDLWGGNVWIFNSQIAKSEHKTTITYAKLINDVPGLGLAGEDVLPKLIELARENYDINPFEPLSITI